MNIKFIKEITLLLSLAGFFACSKEKRSNKAAEKMRQFVIDIANYARKYDSDFIIVPQNGAELAFNNQDSADGLHELYLSSVTGFGVEALFYNGSFMPDYERIEFLKSLPDNKPYLVSEYVKDDGNLDDAINRVTADGWLFFHGIPGIFIMNLSRTRLSMKIPITYIYLLKQKNICI